MTDFFRTTPGMIPPSEARPPSPLRILISYVVGIAVIAGASVWFLNFSQPSSASRERAIRQALGLPQPEDYLFAYPVSGTPIPLDPRCDRSCAERELQPGKDLVQVGPLPQGYVLVDAPPAGCAFLNLRYSPTRPAVNGAILDTPAPVFLDAAPIAQLQECNPQVPLRRNDAGLVQVPPWYRSTTGVAMSVPLSVVSTGLTFRAAVCAFLSNETIAQFAGDENMADLADEMPRYCAAVVASGITNEGF